jgi:hypothetical protein
MSRDGAARVAARIAADSAKLAMALQKRSLLDRQSKAISLTQHIKPEPGLGTTSAASTKVEVEVEVSNEVADESGHYSHENLEVEVEGNRHNNDLKISLRDEVSGLFAHLIYQQPVVRKP